MTATMPLVLDPERLTPAHLEELARSLAEDLADLTGAIDAPRGRVRDPASLVTARELLEAVRAVVDRPGARSASDRAAEANLSYAAMLAVIDLVKSHTDQPIVPAARKPGAP